MSQELDLHVRQIEAELAGQTVDLINLDRTRRTDCGCLFVEHLLLWAAGRLGRSSTGENAWTGWLERCGHLRLSRMGWGT